MSAPDSALYELKEALRQTLQRRGAYGQVQARIRTEVFHALEGDGTTPLALPSDNLFINELIREYLEFNGYHNTLSVLLAETGQPKEKAFDARFLADSLGLSGAGAGELFAAGGASSHVSAGSASGQSLPSRTRAGARAGAPSATAVDATGDDGGLPLLYHAMGRLKAIAHRERVRAAKARASEAAPGTHESTTAPPPTRLHALVSTHEPVLHVDDSMHTGHAAASGRRGERSIPGPTTATVSTTIAHPPPDPEGYSSDEYEPESGTASTTRHYLGDHGRLGADEGGQREPRGAHTQMHADSSMAQSRAPQALLERSDPGLCMRHAAEPLVVACVAVWVVSAAWGKKRA